ncbi:hypothetical protein SL103_17695 [Streptomyces lydicus]|uniref:Uncharacterized protein n=1 Tax=Streptomyces lydicus TaxID=47763 RepID=A0A1D7VM54_9ACTN|nr:hypothetical protein SL103_17695 [Streptomyces lydicus]
MVCGICWVGVGGWAGALGAGFVTGAAPSPSEVPSSFPLVVVDVVGGLGTDGAGGAGEGELPGIRWV